MEDDHLGQPFRVLTNRKELRAALAEQTSAHKDPQGKITNFVPSSKTCEQRMAKVQKSQMARRGLQQRFYNFCLCSGVSPCRMARRCVGDVSAMEFRPPC
jgi:hypothetical protein